MFATETYIKRRTELKNLVGEGLIILHGNYQLPYNYLDNKLIFRQDSTFLYYIGLDIAELIAIIDIDNNKEYLCGNNPSQDDIIWNGPKPSLNQYAQLAGIKNVANNNQLFNILQKAIKEKRNIHYVTPYQTTVQLNLAHLLSQKIENIKKNQSIKLIKAIAKMRQIKEEQEIIEIEKAVNITEKMLEYTIDCATNNYNKSSEQSIKAGIYQIFLNNGYFYSFPPIITTHGEIFHNDTYNNKPLTKGEMLLADIGAETNMHYAGDMTRTIPIGGKFNQQQQEIYNIVKNAQNAVTQNARPGILWSKIHKIAAKVITEGLKDLGLMQGNTEDIVETAAYGLFFPHGIGHLLGIDVHDMENLGEENFGYNQTIKRSKLFGPSALRYALELKPNMTITNEPGIYFIPQLIEKWKTEKLFNNFINYTKVAKYQNFGGIRIEDDMLITETGSKILGKNIGKY